MKKTIISAICISALLSCNPAKSPMQEYMDNSVKRMDTLLRNEEIINAQLDSMLKETRKKLKASKDFAEQLNEMH